MKANIRKVRKVALYGLLSLFLFTLALRILIGIPAVQTKVTSWLVEYLRSEYQIVASIDAVDIEWIDKIGLNGVYLEDHQQDTLAYIGELRISVGELVFSDVTELDFPTVELRNGLFNLKNYQGDTLTNLDVFIRKLGTSESTDTTSSSLKISANGLELSNFSFRYIDENVERDENQIDWSHLNLTKIFADFSDITVVNDTIDAHIHQLACKDHSGFELKRFEGLAHFSPLATQVEDLVIETNESYLALQLDFQYDSIGSYSNFLEEVAMRLTLESVNLQMDDLGYFSSDLKGWNQVIKAEGKARGTVSNLTLRNFLLGYGKSSKIRGNFELNGLPNIEETFIVLNVKELSTNATDIETFPDFEFPLQASHRLEMPDEVAQLEQIDFKGSFTGFINDFVAYGTFNTGLGSVKTDLNVENKEAQNTLAYTGKLSTQRFNLGKLLKSEEMLGKTTFDLTVSGEGLDFETMSAELKGDVKSIYLNKYNYNNIAINGSVNQRIIAGDLSLKDPNGAFQFDGTIDLSGELPKMQFSASADSIALHPLHLSTRDTNAVLSTNLEVNLEGNSVNNIVGTASLLGLEYYEKGKIYRLDSAELAGLNTPKGRKLAISTDNISGFVEGEFNTVELPNNVHYMTQFLFPSLFSEEIQKPKSRDIFDLELTIGRKSQLIGLLVPTIELKEDVHLSMNLNSELRVLDLQLNTQQITVAGIAFSQPNLAFHTENDALDLTFTTQKGALSETSFIENFDLNARATNNGVDVDIDWKNENSSKSFDGNIHLRGDILDPTHYALSFNDSKFKLADTLWTFQDSNKIEWKADTLMVKDFKLSNAESSLYVNGEISKDSLAVMTVDLQEFQLAYLNPFIEETGFTFNGVLDGKTEFSSVYTNLILTADNEFKNLVINNQEIGSGTISSTFDNQKEKLSLDGDLYANGAKTIGFHGWYKPKEKKNNIDLTITLEKFMLEILNPILEENVVFQQGSISGKVSIDGEIEQPQLSGGFYTDQVKTHIIYLNTVYSIDKQYFKIRPDWFGADVLTLVDAKGNEAHANITIAHENFENLNFDIFLYDLNQFTVLNTQEGNGEMYYGNAYLSGYASVSGSQDNLQIEGSLQTGKNTYLAIPLDGPEDAEDTPFIVFVGSEEKQEINYQDQLDLTGIQMNFDFDITPDAKVEIIFDKTVGDVITAQGTGDLSLEINTNGTFNMFGSYEMQKGQYLFTLENIINKRFDVLQGGTINWKGDPYEGRIDMRTEYSLRTTLYNLNISAALDSNAMKQRIPVSLFLDLDGNYTDPTISFSFGLPSNYAEVESILNNLEEGEKNKQAFTLLVLNSFLPITGGTGSAPTSNALGKSSSEFLSNQLSNWLSQISDDFDVGVNYRPGDNISSDEVEVALSTQLFNDRVSIEGNFGVQGSDQSATTSTDDNFIGDFQLEYKISEDGKLRGKMYNETNANDLVNQNQSRYTQGVGVLYQEQFNTWAGFWCRVSQRFVPKAERDEQACVELERKKLLEKREEKARKEEELEPLENNQQN